ncbi:MAG: hypothetical protein AcusKO_30010 [Acuticoccus sp.]
MHFAKTLATVAVAAVIATTPAAQACTGITLTAKDGTVVRARTLEFAVNLQSQVILVPRGYSRTGSTPDDKPGMKWAAKYSSVGTNPEGLPYLVDGINEEGLSMGLFYFDQAAKYQSYSPEDASKTMASWQLGSYILDNFATVEEVKAALPTHRRRPGCVQGVQYRPPVHFRGDGPHRRVDHHRVCRRRADHPRR